MAKTVGKGTTQADGASDEKATATVTLKSGRRKPTAPPSGGKS